MNNVTPGEIHKLSISKDYFVLVLQQLFPIEGQTAVTLLSETPNAKNNELQIILSDKAQYYWVQAVSYIPADEIKASEPIDKIDDDVLGAISKDKASLWMMRKLKAQHEAQREK